MDDGIPIMLFNSNGGGETYTAYYGDLRATTIQLQLIQQFFRRHLKMLTKSTYI